jgi:hypothetical protein
MPWLHRIRTWHLAAAGALGTLALALACSAKNLADTGSIGGNPKYDASPVCGPGKLGCPCDAPGQTVACGQEINRSGDYVTCSEGTSTCQGGVWGACQGSTIYTKSLESSTLGLGGTRVHAKTVGCAPDAGPPQDPCDPSACPPSVSGPGDVLDAAGVITAESGVSIAPSPPDGGPCTGLLCQINSCGGTPDGTIINGKVFDPAGNDPLYNIWVYIPLDPTAPLPPFTPGVSCDTCAGAGNFTAVAVGQTAADGTFTLTHVPDGANIPIVVQNGKWRRKITLPAVSPCTQNVIPNGTLRLPRNRFDGDNNTADIPQIAFVSGASDAFQCMLLKVGLDPNEFGSATTNANRRIHYYNSPDKPSSSIDPAYGAVVTADVLWNSQPNLANYDLVVLACEGAEYTADRAANGYANLANFANIGGRVFLSHYSYVWMKYNTPWIGVPSGWGASASVNTQDPLPATIDTSTPKGVAFSAWLQNVGAIPGGATQIQLQQAREDTVSPLSAGVQSWMSASNTETNSLNKTPDGGPGDFSPTFTFDTPLGSAPNECGRVGFTDFHVSTAALVSATSCSTDANCGYGSTCNLTGMPGTCTAGACSPTTVATDCGDSNFTCTGAIAGTCGCTTDAQCAGLGAGTCNLGNCTVATCYLGSDCATASGTCDNGPQPGTCTPNACATNADCNGELCAGGTCSGCLADTDCPGTATCVAAVPPGTCTGDQTHFPYACRKGALSPQEKALEFELFDLTACISPAGAPPPPPVVLNYEPVTFTEDFSTSCPMGTHVVWRELDWQATIPNTASIVFAAQTVEPPADGGAPDYSMAQMVPLATATTSTANPPVGWDAVLLDVPSDGGPLGAFNLAMPPVTSLSDLRLTITLNPTSDNKASPTLIQWQLRSDCVPSE